MGHNRLSMAAAAFPASLPQVGEVASPAGGSHPAGVVAYPMKPFPATGVAAYREGPAAAAAYPVVPAAAAASRTFLAVEAALRAHPVAPAAAERAFLASQGSPAAAERLQGAQDTADSPRLRTIGVGYGEWSPEAFRVAPVEEAFLILGLQGRVQPPSNLHDPTGGWNKRRTHGRWTHGRGGETFHGVQLRSHLPLVVISTLGATHMEWTRYNRATQPNDGLSRKNECCASRGMRGRLVKDMGVHQPALASCVPIGNADHGWRENYIGSTFHLLGSWDGVVRGAAERALGAFLGGPCQAEERPAVPPLEVAAYRSGRLQTNPQVVMLRMVTKGRAVLPCGR